MRFGVPQSEKFELQGDENQAPVLGDCGVMFSQGGQFLLRIFLPAENRGNGIDSFLDPLFQQGKEDLFLASKIGIEGAARITSPGSDVFEAGGFKAVTGKNAFRRGQQFSPCGLGSLGLPGADPRPRREADPAPASVLCRQ